MRRALKTYPVIAIDVEILRCSMHLPSLSPPAFFVSFFLSRCYLPLYKLCTRTTYVYNYNLYLFCYLCHNNFSTKKMFIYFSY